jgi:glycosyltransferase involved in cell wall biosynthesis
MGPENEYYLSLKQKYSSKHILFLGATHEPLSFIHLFDLGLLPSYFPSESCPSTIVEYLAGNIPVVATNIGEIPNMITFENQYAGTLVDEKNANNLPSIDAFTNAIEQYLIDKTLYAKHKNLCKYAFEKFDMNLIVKEYEKIYINALK